MSKGDKKPEEEKPAEPTEESKAKALATADVIPREMIETLRAEQGSQVNINVLLVQVVEKSSTADEALERSKQAFEMARLFEKQRVQDFRDRAAAISEAKRNDPDEIEKRANNRARRHLKYGLAFCAVVSLVGGLAVTLSGGSIVSAGLFLGLGLMSVAMLGPLASGESLSSNDIVRMINAVSNFIPGARTTPGEQPGRKKK